MNSFTLNSITKIANGKLQGDSQLSIEYISTDTRTIISGSSTLFFALVTSKSDGHGFIEAAIEKGVRAFVVNHIPENYSQNAELSFIQVEDTLLALQKLAVHKRQQYSGISIGITGSNGKTIIKEWLYELLSTDFNITRSPKSFNSQIGVPLSVWMVSQTNNLAIWEAGISEPGEMKQLEPMIRPEIGIFTNIGEAHQSNFESLQQKVNEKMKLFEKASTLICCRDHQMIWETATSKMKSPDQNIFDWSTKNEAAKLFFETIEITPEGTGIVGRYLEKQYAFSIPFSDWASIENACHCFATLCALGHCNEQILNRFSTLQPIAMRLEIKEAINQCVLINDSYNADINSLHIALTTLNQQASKGHLSKTLILSDIHQSGQSTATLYKQVADWVRQSGIARFIGVGTEMMQFKMLFPDGALFFETTDQLQNQLPRLGFTDEAILLKGARDFGFDQIAAALQSKVHETVLEIDLSAMVFNLNYFKSKLKKTTKIVAMVKAFSYGSGTAEIARLLEFHHVDYLAVAIADEGVELRKAGITMPILVMNPEEHSFDLMIESRLEPNIYSISLLQSFQKAAKRNAVQEFPIHIKIDTGMKRLGFETDAEINQIIAQISTGSELHIHSVFSHLAGSDEVIHDEFTQLQIDRFQQLSSLLIQLYGQPIDRHILNSAGIERFPEYQFEMVRLGIGLYGISALSEGNLQNVSTLKTTISQIRTLQPGETVGYGRTDVVNQISRIAILPIGYADGLNRHLSNGVGEVWVNGKHAPIVGRICMDMCMIDITQCQASEGDRVIIFGKEISPLKLAKTLQTIPYEIFTSISQRVKRVYFQE